MFEIKEIKDEEFLYRRIHPIFYDKVKAKISSGAFTDPEASVDWAAYTTPQETIKDYPTCHVASLQAKIPREVNQEVKHNPIPGNYSHSLIIGKKKKSVARFIARNCKFVIKHI